MIHAKYLMQRLSLMPLLFAVGLVFGGVGVAEAGPNITKMSTSISEIRENADRTEVTVTISIDNTGPDEELVGYLAATGSGTPAASVGTHLLFWNVGTFTVAKDFTGDEDSKDLSLTIHIDPLKDTGTADEVFEIGVYTDDPTTANATASITLVDIDKASDSIELSFDPAEINEYDGPTDVTVTATANGEALPDGQELKFSLRLSDDSDLRRDIDFVISAFPTLTIKEETYQASATFTIDPHELTGGADAGILISAVFIKDAFETASGDSAYAYIRATTPVDTVGVDDGLDNVRTRNWDDTAFVPSGTITITHTDESTGLTVTADPASIRENAGATEVELTVELDDDKGFLSDQQVRFEIRDGVNGDRDVNYVAELLGGPVTLPAGDLEATVRYLITPVNDDEDGDDIVLEVMAIAGTFKDSVDIAIIDDENRSTDITLSASPGEIKAGSGETEITVTGEINGGVFDEDVTVVLVLEPGISGGAQRDTDFTAVLRSLTIPAGEIEGSTSISITPINGGDKTVTVKALSVPEILGDPDSDTDGSVSNITITLKDADPADEDEDTVDPSVLAFAGGVDLSATVFEYNAGAAIDALELPAASGGMAPYTYSVSNTLPAGLSFNAATLTITGTPTATGTSTVIYSVLDSDGGSIAQSFSIEVSDAPVPVATLASLTATHTALRENDAAAEITLTVALVAAAAVDETVQIALGAPSAGTGALRDVDYTASLTSAVISIPAGSTEGSTTLTLAPINNSEQDGNRALGVTASGSGSSMMIDIQITDDETPSTAFSLTASPHGVSEDQGTTEIVITATLNGGAMDADTNVLLSIDSGSSATRDVDYSALFNPQLTIDAGEISGTLLFLINPTRDNEEEGNETVTLNGMAAGLQGASVSITLSDQSMEMPDDDMPVMDPLALSDVADMMFTAGTEISSMALPAATGGDDMMEVSYSVSGLPAGLSFDPASRMISGTPEAAGSSEVTYMAAQGDESVSVTFSVTINPPLSFGEFFGLFNAAGKANPAAEVDDDGVVNVIVGVPDSIQLPEVAGGTPPLTYSVTGLPAGLSFDSATRTISGTASETTDAIVVTYMVTDANGAVSSLPFLLAVITPPLGAPGNLVAEDYAGADGQGDQGGFVMLSWELSEHHDSIDGYRIFRALPVLGNEMVPWAMVDAVPGVNMGRAIVATLDNVSTRWGVAAERGGQTTHGAAKAVFVHAESMNQSYEQMAETLMASREAAQAGDAPVFASLLPEALAYAEGAVPRMNFVSGVVSSAITMTEEPVRAIDNIAPLAVPSLNVLDAPGDEGSRIALTWTLSPSDQLLQGTVAGAIGPTAVEPIVGVYGYSIYRKAAGDDEFAMIAQVEAGVASFVDETALNGVRYTYQVRPYDLDNETGSDVEQSAMAVRNLAVDSEGRTLFGLFGTDNRIGFDDFFIFADNFGLTAEDAGFDPAFDLSPSAAIDFEDFFVFADNFGRSTAAAGKRVPMLAGLNADARMYLDARTAMPNVGEDFVIDVSLADFVALKGYGLQVQYEADKLEFVEVLTDQPLGGSELAAPQVLSDEEGLLALVAYGDELSDGEIGLSLVFRPTTEIENTVIEITDNQAYDSAFGFNRLALPAPVQLQTRPEAFALANNYPNPFNPATTIKYALPQAMDVELTVYNVVGQAVRTLVAEHQSAGRYVVEWDATNNSGQSLSSGMYFYRLEAAGGEFLEVKKMLLLK